jgi:hypothetical protein
LTRQCARPGGAGLRARIRPARERLGAVLPPRDRGIKVQEAAAFDERVVDLFDDAAGPFDFIVERTPAWLNWRYCDRRGGQSSVRLATGRDGRLLGYAVLRVQRLWCRDADDPSTPARVYLERGVIADVLVRPGREDALRALIRDAACHFDARGLSSAVAWMPRNHPYREALLREGFAVSGDVIDFRLRSQAPGDPDYAFLAEPGTRIHLMPGDTDTV